MTTFESANDQPFGIKIQYICQSIDIPKTNQYALECGQQKFYLSIPNVARFLALPAENKILIEKFDSNISPQIINTWLYGTVMAYVLQYHGYLVLHGSAVIINDMAVIISGESGAGKSTTANALSQKGYPFITDDLAVLKRNSQGAYCIIPGPAVIKLWDDALEYFKYDKKNAYQIMLKNNKYGISTVKTDKKDIPVRAFYELNPCKLTQNFTCEKLSKIHALQTLIKNTYRYFMLKPLGKLPGFLHDCSALTQQINTYKIARSKDFKNLPSILECIENNDDNYTEIVYNC